MVYIKVCVIYVGGFFFFLIVSGGLWYFKIVNNYNVLYIVFELIYLRK